MNRRSFLGLAGFFASIFGRKSIWRDLPDEREEKLVHYPVINADKIGGMEGIFVCDGTITSSIRFRRAS